MKVGPDYYPFKPLLGNAGNTHPADDDAYSLSTAVDNPYAAGLSGYKNDSDQGDNSEFYNSLRKVFAHLTLDAAIVNQFNFSLNERGFDPTNTDLFIETPGKNGILNTDTVHGLPLYHENRVVGRCIYAIDMESQEMGTNTKEIYPYELIMKADLIEDLCFPR